MRRKSPFKHHRFPRDIILCAVRWYLRYPLSYQDVVDLLEERGIAVDRSTVYRWVQKFGPELAKRAEKHLRRPVTICTDKAPTYRKVIRDENRRYDPQFESITHIDRKWQNSRIESDHAALKRLLGFRQSFRSLQSAKATLSGIETIRTIKRGHIYDKPPGVKGEILFVEKLFPVSA